MNNHAKIGDWRVQYSNYGAASAEIEFRLLAFSKSALAASAEIEFRLYAF